MRRIIALLALVSIGLLVYFLGGLGPAGPELDVRSPESAAKVAEDESEEALLVDDGESGDDERVEPESAAVVEDVEAATPSAAAIVIGRVVDEFGGAIAGAQVSLTAYEVWAEGLDVPRLPGPYDRRGFESSSDADGHFRFEVPVPTAEVVTLRIRPHRFNDSHDAYFTARRPDALPPLREGLCDLGEIRLATTGALVGRVVDDSGTPIADVRIDTGPGASTTYGRGATTDADGRYVVPHARVGSYAIKAKIEGYLSGYIEPVTVEPKQDTKVADFVLARAPSIEGDVVDPSGAPLEGVRFWGWPSTEGSGASAKSDADGHFVVYLPQNEPYSLSAKLDGYLPWGNEHDKNALYEPGTQGLRVVMESLAKTTFQIVDSTNGNPIEEFGFNILEDNGSLAPNGIYTERRRPRLRKHEGGVIEASARPGIDLYVAAADGYLLATGDVEQMLPGERRQVIQMRRGATLRGRVLHDGEPVAGADVKAVHGWLLVREAKDGTPGKRAFRPRANTLLTARTDEAGRFEIIGLEKGTHRVTIDPAELPEHSRILEVESDEVDLGDIELDAGGTIAGTVLVPVGIDPAGLRICLDDWRNTATTVTDANGRFTFEGVASGEHSVLLDERPGELASRGDTYVQVVAGETANVTIDATDRAMCAIAVTLDLGGLPVEGHQIDVVSAESPREYVRLGRTDAQGRVEGAARAWGETRIRVYLPGGSALYHPDRITLEAAGDVRAAIAFEFSKLTLKLPFGSSMPEDGSVAIELEAPEQEVFQRFRVRFSEGRQTSPSLAFASTSADRIELFAVLAGSYSLDVEFDRSSGSGPVEGSRQSIVIGKPVVIDPGQDAAIDL